MEIDQPVDDVVELGNEGSRVPELLDPYKDYKFTQLSTNVTYEYLYSTYGCPNDYNNGYTLHLSNNGREIEVYSTDLAKSFRVDLKLDIFDKPAVSFNSLDSNERPSNEFPEIRNVDIQTEFSTPTSQPVLKQEVTNSNTCTVEEKNSFKKIFECLKCDKKVTFETVLKIPYLTSLKVVYENLEFCKNEFIDELVEFIFDKNGFEDVITKEVKKNIKNRLNEGKKTVKKKEKVQK